MMKVIVIGFLGIFMSLQLSLAKEDVKSDSYTVQMNKRVRAFRDDMGIKLKDIDKKIETLQQRAGEKVSAGQQALNEKVEDLKEMREDLAERMDDLSDSTQDSYADLKLKVEHQYEKLANEVNKAFN